jgi:hypothetical protein
MPRYTVNGHLTISISTTVEAKSVREAKRLALEQPLQDFCHQCSSADPVDYWATCGELDGEPQIDSVEEE